MTHKYAHEVEVGTKWQKRPYSSLIGFYDKAGAVTHTVLIGRKKCYECGKFKNDVCHSHGDDPSWCGIIASAGFASKGEAKRKGFEGVAPYGFSENRVAANMILSVWNMKKAEGESNG